MYTTVAIILRCIFFSIFEISILSEIKYHSIVIFSVPIYRRRATYERTDVYMSIQRCEQWSRFAYVIGDALHLIRVPSICAQRSRLDTLGSNHKPRTRA